jgi:uncharacterized protein (TIGR00369 family)
MTTKPEANDSSHTRTRIMTWQDPAAVRAQAEGQTGLEIMRGIRDGTLPPPPMARLIGFACVAAEPGHIVMELVPDESLENAAGLLHGGTAAAMLDTAMGAAAHTMLTADKMTVTLDLTLTYLEPLTLASGPIRASGRVQKMGGRTAYVEGEITDAKGRRAVHAVGNFSIVTPRPPSGKDT